MIDGETLIRDAAAGPRGDRRAARAGLRDPPGAGDAPRGPVRRRRRPTSTSAGAPARAARRRSCWPPRCGALLDGRYNVSFEDIRRVYLPALRHRVLLNFEAQAEGIDTDDVLLKVLDAVPEKADEKASAAKAG